MGAKLMKCVVYTWIILLVATVHPVLAQDSARNNQKYVLISIELHNTSIRAAIDLLFRQAGIKYIIGPGVTGTIPNLSLKKITFYQALVTLSDAGELIYRIDTEGTYWIYAKQQTVHELSKHPDKCAVDSLIWFLEKGISDERSEAAKVLGDIGDKRAADALVKACKDEHLGVRFCASEALAKMGDKRAVTSLVKIFLDKDSHFLVEAGKLLAKLGGSEAIDGLYAALKQGDPGLRRCAVGVLGKIEDDLTAKPLAEALKDKDDMVRSDALRALVGYSSGPPSTATLPGGLERRNEHPWTDDKRRTVIKAGAIPVLIQMLKAAWTRKEEDTQGSFDGNPGWLAAELLGRLRAKQAVEPLIASLKCKDDDIFALSVWALGEIGDDQALEPLLNSLGRPDRYARNKYNEWVYDALWKYGKSAEAFLRSRLKDGNTDQQSKAAMALKMFEAVDE